MHDAVDRAGDLMHEVVARARRLPGAARREARDRFEDWRQAADDMGIDTRRVKLFCFMLCSFLAGFAGMITTFRLKSALPALGEGLELQAIAAAPAPLITRRTSCSERPVRSRALISPAAAMIAVPC